MAFALVVDRVAYFRPPPSAPTAGTDFVCNVAMDGQNFQFHFAWNGRSERYSLDILRSDGTRVKKLYPVVDEFNLIRNWNPKSGDRPDAFVAIVDTTGNEEDITPTNVGKSHLILVALGRYRPL